MRDKIFSSSCTLAALLIASLLGGCGNDNNPVPASLVNAAKVGNATCLQTGCHATTMDLTMTPQDGRTIAAVYTDSVHNTPDFDPTITALVGCEDCHGGGQFHTGAPGTIAYPNPGVAQCVTCHKPPFGNFPTDFPLTAHANSNQFPDKFFFTGGTGTNPVNAGNGTTVTQNQRIEECSVCHDNNQRFVYDAAGNLTKPDPNNMPMPAVACASCHDGHQVGKLATVTTRPAGPNPAGNVVYPIFRKVQIAGAGPFKRPDIRPRPFSLITSVFSSTELVCASCHTKGALKYSQIATHQTNVFSQWTSSAHNDRIGVPWRELSLGSYPVDLSVAGNANPGTCAKCHNGLSSPVFMDPSPTTRRPNAPTVVWNPTTATCVTCHDPHANGAGTTNNVRTPAVMTNYSGAGLGVVFGNVFLDTQPLPVNPSNPNSIVCIFCHQGRESGLSLFKDKLAAGRTMAGNFKNNHYLGTAAMLWGVNAYEYPSSSLATSGYTVNLGHQATNCTGCHMANGTEPVNVGGHTWRPNPASCNACHSEITAATDLSLEPNAGFLATNALVVNSTNYSGNLASVSIAQQIRDLQNYIIALLAANGVFYDDTNYPYYFRVALTAANGSANNHASANAFTTWSSARYKASFNLAIAVKANPSATASTTYVLNGAGVRVPDSSQTLLANKSAAVHNYKYVIQLLMDSYTDLYNYSVAHGTVAAAQTLLTAGSGLTLPAPATLNANRPPGTRQAVNYGAYAGSPGLNPTVTYGGTFNPNQ